MKTGRIRIALTILLLFVAFDVGCAFAAEYEGGVKVTLIKKAITAANGQKLAYSGTANPEVTAALVEIPPGGDTGWHFHPIPVYAYVLSGSITVEIQGSGSYEFKEGDAILEVINTPHIGRNKGRAPVKLVVFYTGEEGGKNTGKAAAAADSGSLQK